MFRAEKRRPKALVAGAALALGLAGREAVARWREADLTDQVALITGGSRGLGLALARELADEGCRLAICARDESELERARTELEQAGAEVLAVPCDVADRAQVEAMVEAVTARFGRIDVLVNNAGIIVVAPLGRLSHADFERLMAINFWGVVNPTLAVLPRMRAQGGGRIANITSIGGKISVPHLLPYNCAKFAALGFSEGLRAELANDGISVTTIVPGLMRTGSYLRAEFGGDQEGEYRWFGLGASAPFPVTVSADRAARGIVRAVKRGKAEYTFPLSAVVATRLNGVAPAATARALALVDRFLPAPDGATGSTALGMTVEERIDSPVMAAATTLGRAAAEEYRQYPTADGQPSAD